MTDPLVCPCEWNQVGRKTNKPWGGKCVGGLRMTQEEGTNPRVLCFFLLYIRTGLPQTSDRFICLHLFLIMK